MKNKYSIVIVVLFIMGTVSLQAQNENRINHSDIDVQLSQLHSQYSHQKTDNSKLVMSYGNPPSLNWKGQFGGSGYDNINAVVTDNTGNIFVTGSFYDEMSFSGNTYTSTGKREAFVAKFSNTGSLVWLTQIPATANMETAGNGICMDASGNLFVTGYYNGAITVGSSNLPNNNNNYSMFYAKLNAQGQLQNGGYHSQNTFEQGLDIGVDANGDIYICASNSEGLDSRHSSWLLKFDNSNTQISAKQYDVGFNNIEIIGNSIYYSGVIQTLDNPVLDTNVTLTTPLYYNDVFIAKSNLAGVFDWGITAAHNGFGDSMDDRIEYSDNNLYVTGSFRGSIAFGMDTIITSNGNFLTKLDTLGNAQWLKIQTISDVINLTTDNTGNVYVMSNDSLNTYSNTGAFTSRMKLDNTPIAIKYSNNKIITVGSNEGLIYVSQYLTTGNREWIDQFGGTSAYSEVLGMRTDDDGFVYSYNYTSGTIDYMGTTVNKGLFICKQTGQGNIVWLKQINDVYVDATLGSYINIDPSNQNLYITGATYDTISIPGQPDIIPGIDGITFIIKYGLDGSFKWAKSENFYGWILSLAPDYSNNIILSGTFEDTITISGTVLQSAGDLDCFIAKYDVNGSLNWVKRAGGETVEYSGLVAVDGSDNIYLTGEFTSENVTVDATSYTMLPGDGNVLFAKLNSMGSVLFVKSFASSNHPWYDDISWPTGIITDSLGNSYIKGNLSYKGIFDSITLQNPDSYFNKFITKVNNAGAVQWAKMISQPNRIHQFDYNQFDVDKYGAVYFGMQAKDTLDFGNSFQYVPSSTKDLFVAKYSTSGLLDWVKTMEGNNDSYTWISSVAAYDNTNVFVGGLFRNYLSIENQAMTSDLNHGFISMFGPNMTSGFKEVYNANNLNIDIFPNPTNDNITFITTTNLSNARVNVYSITGKFIRTELLNSKTVDVRSLPKGVYVVKLITQKGQIFTDKFVKN